MSLRYCSLHGRLFSYTYQCWVPFPEEKIHDIKGYYTLLRTTQTEAFALQVVETGCDECAATCRRGWMSQSPSPRTKRSRPPHEARMPKKCAHCGIRLDVPCTNPACDGHHNESRGDVCVYCATNERTHMGWLRKPSSPLVSCLDDIGHGED